jgi:hypothetical protein
MTWRPSAECLATPVRGLLARLAVRGPGPRPREFWGAEPSSALAPEPLGFYVVGLRSARAGWHLHIRSSDTAALRTPASSSDRSGRNGRSHSPSLVKTFRPLAIGAVGQIAEAMGWTISYRRGVLTPWKMSAVYCQAVLAHDQRIALDGTPAALDTKAKDSATKRLAHLAARHAAKQAAAPAKAKPKPAPPIETPPPLRDRVRAGLLRRRA